MAKNITHAFHSIHELGVMHGDVRRENILVREDDSVIIIDFESSDFDGVSENVLAIEEATVGKLLSDLEKGGDNLNLNEREKIEEEYFGF